MKKNTWIKVLGLAILILELWAVNATAERTAAEELTGFVPGDVLGFVATSGGDELADAFNESRLGKIWREPTVQQFYGKIKNEIGKVLALELSKDDEEDKDADDDNDDDEDGEDNEIDDEAQEVWGMLDSVKMILHRPLLVGVGEMPGKDVPIYGFLIVKAGDRKEQIQTAVNQFIKAEDDIKDEMEMIALGEMQISKVVKDDVVVLWGWIDDYFVISVNDDEARIFQRLTSASLDDLRATKFPGLEKVQGASDLAIKYINVERIMKLITNEAKQKGIKDADIVKVQNVLNAFGVSAVKTIVAKGGFAGREMVGNALVALGENRNGLCGKLNPVDLNLLDKVPASAIEASAWNVDLGGLYDVVMRAVSSLEEDEFEKMTREIEKFEKEAGFQIRKELLASLTGEMVSYELPSSGMMGGLSRDGVLLARLKDAKLFEKCVATFVAYHAKKENKDFEIMQQELNGRTYTLLMIPQMAMMQINPTWTIEGDWLIAGNNMMQVNAALHAATQPPQIDSIRNTAGFKGVTKKLSVKPVYFRYGDQAAQMKDYLRIVQQFWPVVVMGLQKQVNMNLPMMLPPQENIVKHLGPSVEYWWFDSDGLRYHGEGAVISGSAQIMAGAAIGAGLIMPAIKSKNEKTTTTTPATLPSRDTEKFTPANCKDIPCGETAKKNEKKKQTSGESKS